MLFWLWLWPRALPRAGLLCALALVGLAGCRRGFEPNLLRDRSPSSITHAEHAERLTDGVRAVAGDTWNSSLASVLGLGASIEWDLGAVQPIAAASLSADNNDEYALLASDDRVVWRTIWEAPSVREAGQQLRVGRDLAARGRFVRLEPRGGDGAYSVSEVALYRSASAPTEPDVSERSGGNEASVARREAVLPLVFATILTLFALGFYSNSNPLGSKRERERLFLLAGAALLVIVSAVMYRARYRHNTIDDAYISFQYAKNWASGQGLVFNPGERVEGYSNFLWVALLAPLWPLSGHDPDTFATGAFVLALGCALVSLAVVVRVAVQEFATRVGFLLALLLVAFDDAWLCYAVFSLETHLVVLCTVAALGASVLRFSHWQSVLGLCFALLAMTRLDGLLFALCFFAVEGVRWLRLDARRREEEWRGLVRIAVCFALPFSFYFWARYQYYGALLPNTFYLKVGDTLAALPRGLEYARTFLAERYGVPLLALVGVFAWNRRRWVPWLFLHVLLHFAYVIYVGGDFYSGHRFLLALTPSLALLTAAGFEACLERWPGRALRMAAPPVALAACLLLRWGTIADGPFVAEIRVWNDVVDNNVRYARWLKGVARPNASLVLGDIGGAGFFADLRVHDVYGVVDPRVAHRKVDGFGTGKAGHEKVALLSDFLERKPTYIKLGFLPVPNVLPGYYVFNDFPPGLDIDGLLVQDDLSEGHTLPELSLHMNADELGTWTREGEAFAQAPSAGPIGGQAAVAFADGSLINSFTAADGDRATGRLRSPAFTLAGDRMRLLVGGGRDPERLRVSLLVDDCAVFSETGTNHEVLGRREWDITPYRGKPAVIEVVDQATGAWGHLLVDEVTQWVGRPNESGKL
ncbi:MAG TPA: hypothetical protein VG937_12640 [Polyangiaceae bacterium]|nr:hypothetical protein [Polyangiaceae bacterium]